MFAKVVLASKPTNGAPPIITIHARYPRIIHAEIMTHRVFSRNARSSRAVPVATMLKEIRETPFVPWHWGANQKGMQAGAECDELIVVGSHWEGGPHNDREVKHERSREAAWLLARDEAVHYADAFSNAGYHKQIANRLIEPFSFIDTLITSTSWANFLHLRDHTAAEPHFQDLAAMFREAIEGADYEPLEPGQWHLPYVPHWERSDIVKAVTGKMWQQDWDEYDRLALAKISVARCARISYKPFDGDASIEKELERYDLLVGSSPLHASPAEHQATPDKLTDPIRESYRGASGTYRTWEKPHLAGNLGPGWVQFRKTLPGEYVADAA
ncbi:thymidylate synthase [Rhizobium lentis]|nr:thymidylate synthase [Rhizobium lentis]